MALAIDIPQAQIAAFCIRNRIRRLALMGYLGLSRLQRELSTLLGGRQVDVKTPRALSRYFRDAVQSTAYVIYGPD